MRFKRSVSIGLAVAGASALGIATITPAWADSRSINFEAATYHTGSIDGQDGWGGQDAPGNTHGPMKPLIDEAVVMNCAAPASFGQQRWLIANCYTSCSFVD